MTQLQLDSHQQKLLLRKIFSLFEKDVLLEFFKLRIERKGDVICLSAAGQRAGKEIVAREEGENFQQVVHSLREQLLAQLPKHDDSRWYEEPGTTDVSANA